MIEIFSGMLDIRRESHPGQEPPVYVHCKNAITQLYAFQVSYQVCSYPLTVDFFASIPRVLEWHRSSKFWDHRQTGRPGISVSWSYYSRRLLGIYTTGQRHLFRQRRVVRDSAALIAGDCYASGANCWINYHSSWRPWPALTSPNTISLYAAFNQENACDIFSSQIGRTRGNRCTEGLIAEKER